MKRAWVGCFVAQQSRSQQKRVEYGLPLVPSTRSLGGGLQSSLTYVIRRRFATISQVQMTLSRLQAAAIFGIIACLAALAVAFGSEWYGGMVPCALCLVERWPYRIGIAIGLAVLVLPRAWSRAALWLLVLTMLGGAAVAGVHVGVEQKWWASPMPECMAPNLAGMTMAQRLAAMPLRPSKPCEDPDYPIAAIPITFTQADMGYALAVAAILAIWLGRTRRSTP
jgi:disulfide bond formation protein DsbB